MEQDKAVEMTVPDAIIIPAGGSVLGADGEYHSTSYDDGDSFGTLGGYARVEAASILAKQFLNSAIIASGKGAGDGKTPSHAAVMERELIGLGVEPRRITREEESTTTFNGTEYAEALAKRNGWRIIIFITNEYHIPRMKAMWESLSSNVQAEFVSAEGVISESRPEFTETFSEIKKSPAYIKRLESEARGLEAFLSGKYRSARLDDKRERLV